MSNIHVSLFYYNRKMELAKENNFREAFSDGSIFVIGQYYGEYGKG